MQELPGTLDARMHDIAQYHANLPSERMSQIERTAQECKDALAATQSELKTSKAENVRLQGDLHTVMERVGALEAQAEHRQAEQGDRLNMLEAQLKRHHAEHGDRLATLEAREDVEVRVRHLS